MGFLSSLAAGAAKIGGAIVGAVKAFGPKIVAGVKSFASGVGRVAKAAWTGVKKVGAKIATQVPKIGEKVAHFAGRIVGAFMRGKNKIEEIEPAIDKTGEVLNQVEEGIGLPVEPPLETGAKIAQENSGSIEDFDNSPMKYYEHLCKEVELLKEKLEKLTPAQTLTAKIEGCALQMMACSEKLGMIITADFANIISKTIMEDLGGKLTPELAAQLIIGLKNLGISDTDKIVAYLKGEAGAESISIGQILEKAVKEYCSGLGEAKDAINEMKEKTREFEQNVEEFEKKEEMAGLKAEDFEDMDFGVNENGEPLNSSAETSAI